MMRTSLNNRDRRGVLLLVVLSLLTLFLLLGTTYIILASRARTTSRAFLRLADDQARESSSWRHVMRDAALQVIRGTSSSVLHGHDLLADRYGGSSATYRVRTATSLASRQLLRLELTGPSLQLTECGRILTYADDTGLEGQSTRIVDIDTGSNAVVLPWPKQLAAAGSLVNATVKINSPDFSGTGFDTDRELRPARHLDTRINVDDGTSVSTGTPNERYDAIDSENMALASADGTTPSFVRREVANYWLQEFIRVSESNGNVLTASDAEARLVQLLRGQHLAGSGRPDPWEGEFLVRFRQATLRPFPFDHCQDPNHTIDFTGRSLSDLSILLRQDADVDTDGDGVLDAAWLDIGASPVLMPDRRWVKPLVAIRCLDLQGRLDLNVHGSPIHALLDDPRSLATLSTSPLAYDSGPLPDLTAGSGFGPADVRLDAVISPASMRAVLFGSTAAGGAGDGMTRALGGIVGRYGGIIGTNDVFPRPGRAGVDDRRLIDPRIPGDYWTGTSPSGFVNAPPDYWSRFSFGIDHFGHPISINRADWLSLLETTDNPYELDLFSPFDANAYLQPPSSPSNWVDQPFTVSELEAILRPFDVDNAAGLPPRALALSLSPSPSHPAGSLATNRLLLTTRSWTTPFAAAAPPGGSFSSNTHDWDLARGLKMDLNRPLGDGIDNDGNGVADDTLEGMDSDGDGQIDGMAGVSADPYAVPLPAPLESWQLTRGVDLNTSLPNTQPGPDSATLRARQLYAWHIYNLLDSLRDGYETFTGTRLFAVEDDSDSSQRPEARDLALEQGGTPDPPPPLPPTSPETRRSENQDAHTQRVLAQWAVNIVDFFDADAVMTPFRYQSGTGAANVVWGCEYPDLLITESLAFHDRRTADTPNDTSGKTLSQTHNLYTNAYNAWNRDRTRPKPNPLDPDGSGTADWNYDQVRIPQGSLFVELHATRSQSVPNPPRELYRNVAGEWLLDLDRVPPGGTEPVWRLAFAMRPAAGLASPPLANGDPLNNDPFRLLAAYPDTEWLSPNADGEVGDAATIPPKPATDASKSVTFNRYAWFTQQRPPVPGGGASHQDNTYYNRGAQPAFVRRGGYFVAGSRPTTAVGSLKNGGALGVPSAQRILLNNASPAVVITDLNGVLDEATSPTDDLPEASAVVLSADVPSSWSGGAGIGMSVSEPLRPSYYLEPTTTNPATGQVDAYGSLDGTHNDFPTTPFDQNAGSPLADYGCPAEGTVPNFATVVLQRLADPTRPHEPDPSSVDWNPYISLDFQPVDLTVFTGEFSTPDPSEYPDGPRRYRDPNLLSPPPATPLPPDELPLVFSPNAPALTGAGTRFWFATRQRGFDASLEDFSNEATFGGTGSIVRNRNPWQPLASLDDLGDSTPGNRPPFAGPSTPRSRADLDDPDLEAHFMFEINQPAAARGTAPFTGVWEDVPFHSLGWVNSCYGRRLGAGSVPAEYVGAPDLPFPEIVWNDRPFSNAYELVFVPGTAPSRLLTNFRLLDRRQEPGAEPVVAGDVDGDGLPNDAVVPDDLFGAQDPGAHLLPLTSLTDRPIAGGVDSVNADVFASLFEYVRVKSPFQGADQPLADWPLAGPGDGVRFKPPFHSLPAYREPGGVNLNTIPPAPNGDAVWNGLLGKPDGGQPTFSNLQNDRELPLTSLSNAAPPFREFLSDQFSLSGDPVSPRSFTLLGDIQDPAGPSQRTSLFSDVITNVSGLGSHHAAVDARRQARFAFEPLIRAASTTTPRSEVYAIWVTMGLFEVEQSDSYTWHSPAGVTATIPAGATGAVANPLYQDGYKLVREYGSDTGQITRRRAFFLYDRSVPVEYDPGSDTNVENGILLERFIE